ncbi:hypothetical protein BD779DRAFT_112247 [Infundibulicybe gibba]|nr:hypothetical protein BD779DRAFT_112247 [Infundibulicybe gibba]
MKKQRMRYAMSNLRLLRCHVEIGGADTSVSVQHAFFLAMVLNPGTAPPSPNLMDGGYLLYLRT